MSQKQKEKKEPAVKEEYKIKIIALILALFPKAKIYLFGSRAINTHFHGSDIDIAIDNGARIETVDLGEMRDILNATHIPHKIDLVDINFIPAPMKEDILHKEGILWKK
jgi:predicted nucleotidyltransferase